jgi:hypothetical protein
MTSTPESDERTREPLRIGDRVRRASAKPNKRGGYEYGVVFFRGNVMVGVRFRRSYCYSSDNAFVREGAPQ